MCFLCAATSTFDPGRHPGEGPDGGDPSLATIFESGDAAASTGTSATMSVGDTFSGSLGFVGDRDWVAVNLTSGSNYEVALSSFTADTYLRVYDSSGTLIYSNDDISYPSNTNSFVSFIAGYSGTFYVAAGSYNDAGTGSYTMSVTEVAAPAPATLTELANYLTDGYWNFNGASGRSFDTSSSNVITVNLTGLTADGLALARWALEVWEAVVDLEFVETSGSADITFDDNDSGAYATTSTSGGNIISSDINVSTAWLSNSGTQIGTYSLQTYIHEIGHALGLGHQGGYNGSATYGIDETFSNDSWQMSIMSYFSQTENTTTNASFAYIVSLMMADIVAGQNLYGASTVTNGNTTWGANTNLGGYWATLFGEVFDGVNNSSVANNAVAFTIFDNGGTDTFDLSPATTNNRIDMRGGYFSSIAGGTGNVGIAEGTVLENLISGSGNDTITGNDADNEITGGGGNDSIDGGAGSDTAVINATLASVTVTDLGGGSVRITSADGTDVFDNFELFRFSDGTVTLAVLLGGTPTPTTGDDIIDGTSSPETIDGLAGNDSIRGLGGRDSLLGNAGNDTLLGGVGNDTLIGGADADRLLGGSDNDRMLGGNGSDTMLGEFGEDTLFGGAGNDLLRGNGGNDTLNGDAGNDTLIGGNLYDRLDGGDGNDRLDGGTFADTLLGRNGDDLLLGGGGQDRLFGGADNDSGEGGNGHDRFWGGTGNDTFTGGAGDDKAWGEAGDDSLRGGGDNDTLYGGGGYDTLDGGVGNDELTGGLNADVFVFADGHGDDTITDFNATNGSEDIDFSSVSAITSISDLLNNHILSTAGGNVVIDTGGGNTLTLLGVNVADLGASDFIF
ncbi:M10 family metallopeptidase C-terminal domain-containing protein [Shimia sp. Alg240-R146]|uniref:M10 family metallopeptidase C-terminal domain-containing protein n=1 Tax=Shimia sp. Alg240-R146 TaxID=2993449 RepID=UPI0022E16D0B|nr:M10 family metallopeptidase C-terminal domain-containing protein [Shimia sp. Alg240-R146]